MAVKSLTLAVISDRDLLYTLEEVADAEGYATANDVAEKLNIDHPNPTQCVGSRFGWLKKFGAMEAEIKEGETHWRMNDLGESLIHPKKGMTKSFEEALATLSEANQIAVTEHVSGLIAKNNRKSGRTTAHLSRRAWQHNMGGWKDKSIAAKRTAPSAA